jgi:hypothetical protein
MNMLLDIRREAESIYSLIAYLETKPKRGRYEYLDCLRCPLSQYFSEKFGRPMYVDDTFYAEVWGSSERPCHVGELHRLPKDFDNIAVGNYADTSWTYGKMLARARKAAGLR